MPAVERKRLEKSTFLVLFALAAWLCWRTVEPVWIPLFLGLVIAVGLEPLQERFHRHPRLGATLLTAVAMTLLLGLGAFLFLVVGTRVLQVAREAAARYQQGGAAA